MRLFEEKKWRLTGGYHFHYTDRHKKERCSGIQISAVNEKQEALGLNKINKITHKKPTLFGSFGNIGEPNSGSLIDLEKSDLRS